MTQIHADLFEESSDPARRITPLTRRDIFDYIRTEGGPWWGRLDEIDFLARIYDLEALPSNDYRFKTASGDIWQHRDAQPRRPAPRKEPPSRAAPAPRTPSC